MTLVVASLYLGTAGLIMAAWIIDRFGIGHGFWIALATAAVIELTAGAMQAVSLLSMHGSVEAFAPFAITATLMAVTGGLGNAVRDDRLTVTVRLMSWLMMSALAPAVACAPTGPSRDGSRHRVRS